jgi:hypothetical protein
MAMIIAAQSNNHVVLTKVIVITIRIVMATYFVDIKIAHGRMIEFMDGPMTAASTTQNDLILRTIWTVFGPG